MWCNALTATERASVSVLLGHSKDGTSIGATALNTPIDTTNPFGYNRKGFAWEHIPASSLRHLDFGCYDGQLLHALQRKGVRRLVGIDASSDALDLARKQYPEIEFIHMTRTAPLPFDDGDISSITILDVIEHLCDEDQTALLRECHRVLAPGGTLVITTPRQHIFSFLDAGNLKFRFPRLHRWWFCRTHTREEYEYRYVSNPDGLVGDVSARKRWHEHFRPAHMASLLEQAGFRVECFDGSCLFHRAVVPLLRIFRRLRLPTRPIDRFLAWDARRFQSMNLFCLARKLDAMTEYSSSTDASERSSRSA